MADYKLDNGKWLRGVQITPTPKASGSVEYKKSEDINRKGSFQLSSSNLYSVPGPSVVDAWSADATAFVQGFSLKDLQDNDLRFMQLARVNQYSLTYAGKRSGDGMVDITWDPILLSNWFLDCRTNSMITAALRPPYYDDSTTGRSTAPRMGYLPSLHDTPGTWSELDTVNKTAGGKWNYMWRYASDILFLSYLVFVPKTGERQPIEGRKWRVTMELVVNWSGGEPKTKELHCQLEPTKDPVVLPPTDPLFKLMVNPGPTQIMNIVNNQLITSNFNGQHIDELGSWWEGFLPDFWT